MVKEIIQQHKLEKEKFLSKEYIFREKLEFGKKFLNTELVKIIIGPRRAGKSVFCFLLLKNEKFGYINFDDENLLKVKNYDEILKAFFEVYPDIDFILFDEIQNLDKWEIFVNKLQRRGHNIILTGSNARLLSKELATALTGRFVPIEIFPFSFKEFLQVKNFKITENSLTALKSKAKLLNYIDEYLKIGGFPEIIVKGLEPKIYLETLFDALLFKDVVKRYKVKFSQKIYDLASYLVSNFSSKVSYTKLRNILEFRSTLTVQNYMKYLEDAYVFFLLNRFSFKMKEQVKSPRKIYLSDNGWILAKSFNISQNIGRLMENAVFVSLLNKGHKINQNVFYYQTKNKREVDFILKQGVKITKLIQVCYKLDDIEVKEREVKALIEASRELKCDDLLIITFDFEKKDEKIKFIPLWKWLIKDN